MKKNKMMRVASVLLIAVLLTTSAISGTFAKYVTSDSAKDTARVAKFGVVASIQGDLFGSSYAKGSNTIQTWTVNGESVSASDSADTKLLAPGTKGGTMAFAVTGTPEVSTAVNFEAAHDENGADANLYFAEPQLKAGEYGVMVEVSLNSADETAGKWKSSDQKTFTQVTTAETAIDSNAKYYELQDGTGTLSAAYFPITWSYKIGNTEVKTNSLNTAFTAFADYFTTAADQTAFKPNEENALSATLTWDWFFEGGLNDTAAGGRITNSIYSEQDKADTILGDMIAAAASTGKLAEGQYVVAKSGDNFAAVKTASVKIDSAESCANNVTVAYIGDTVPTSAYTSWPNTLNSGVIAVLGAAFNASLTVTQVD